MKKSVSVFYALFFVLMCCAASVSAQEDQSKYINISVVNIKSLKLTVPSYPSAAKAVNAGGAVNVEVLVDEKGNVVSAKSISGHPLLRRAAEAAALESKFSPALSKGIAVTATGNLIYNFSAVEDSPKTDSVQNETSSASKSDEVVLNEKAVSLPSPVYPASAQAVRASGAVSVRVTVDEKGNVVSANAESGHPLLRAAAETAARQAKFSPASSSGKTDKISGVLIYDFPPK